DRINAGRIIRRTAEGRGGWTEIQPGRWSREEAHCQCKCVVHVWIGECPAGNSEGEGHAGGGNLVWNRHRDKWRVITLQAIDVSDAKTIVTGIIEVGAGCESVLAERNGKPCLIALVGYWRDKLFNQAPLSNTGIVTNIHVNRADLQTVVNVEIRTEREQ